jgi:hypothetical protein
VNGLLRGESFETGEQLLSWVDSIYGSLEKWTLTKVFLAWMRRLERWIETGGDYVAQPKINMLVVIGFKRWVSRWSWLSSDDFFCFLEDAGRSDGGSLQSVASPSIEAVEGTSDSNE